MSKKISLLFILLFLFFFGFSQERRFNFYPNLAFDLGGAIPFPLSDIPEGAGGTPKPYPSLGIGSIYHFNERWDFSFEINYHLLAFSANADVISQAFNEKNATFYFSGHTETDVELRMVEFPINAHYKLKKGRKIILGLYYSRILEGRFETKGTNGVLSPDKSITDNANLPGIFDTEYNFNEYLDKYDIGILLGYSYNVNSHIILWGKLNIGCKSIFKKEFDKIDYELYQLRVNLGISYKLFN